MEVKVAQAVADQVFLPLAQLLGNLLELLDSQGLEQGWLEVLVVAGDGDVFF